MSVPLRVLGDRVLIKPDVNSNAPEQNEGGIFLAGSLAAAVTGEDPTESVHRGTVIAVGRPIHPLKQEAEALAATLDRFQIWEDDDLPLASNLCADAAAMLRDLVRREPCVQVGDDVIYSHDAGQNITIDHETYVMLHEAELLGVLEPECVHG